MGNSNLKQAKRAKNDEFYTQLKDIEKELKHYTKHFEGKTVYMNCDNPNKSNFWKYFKDNFKELKLKRIASTYFNEGGKSFKTSYDGETVTKVTLAGNGDFRSDESIKILKESDIVVTNPPFSLFREYIEQLIEHGKNFIVIGSLNAVTYKNVFPLIKDSQIWLGNNQGSFTFEVPVGFEKNNTFTKDGRNYAKFGNIVWYTNLSSNKERQNIKLTRLYSGIEYPVYDNYDAINVDKVVNIPVDYNDAMGVPITFLGKHNLSQFEILDANKYRKNDKAKDKPHGLIKDKDGSVDGKNKYARVLIKRK